MALALFSQEAEGLLNTAKAHILIEEDVDENRLTDQLLDMEEMARFDRAIAVAISEGREPPTKPERHIRPHRSDHVHSGYALQRLINSAPGSYHMSSIQSNAFEPWPRWS